VEGCRGIVMDVHTLLRTYLMARLTISDGGCVVSRGEYVAKNTCLIAAPRAHHHGGVIFDDLVLSFIG